MVFESVHPKGHQLTVYSCFRPLGVVSMATALPYLARSPLSIITTNPIHASLECVGPVSRRERAESICSAAPRMNVVSVVVFTDRKHKTGQLYLRSTIRYTRRFKDLYGEIKELRRSS